jgi:hypothetical protein
MTSIFEVETIISKWAPPFTKENTTQVFNVKKGELFDLETHMKEETFMLKEENGDAAIVEYDRRFIPKKGIYSANFDVLAPQTMRLHQGKAVEFSFMWGEIGITKKITYQGMNGEKAAPKEEPKTDNSDDLIM